MTGDGAVPVTIPRDRRGLTTSHSVVRCDSPRRRAGGAALGLAVPSGPAGGPGWRPLDAKPCRCDGGRPPVSEPLASSAASRAVRLAGSLGVPGPLPAPSVDWRGSGAAPDLALQARPAKPQEAGGGRGPAAWPRGVAAFRLCFRQVPGSPAPAEFKGERGGGGPRAQPRFGSGDQ